MAGQVWRHRGLVRFTLALALGVVHWAASAADDAAPLASASEVYTRHARYLVEAGLAAEHGEGVPKDPLLAAKMYCVAAGLGDAEAMYALGWMYANGRGVPRSEAYAGTLFAMAAYSGHAYARRMERFTGDYSGEVPDCIHAVARAAEGGAKARGGADTVVGVDGIIAALEGGRRETAKLVAKLAPRYGINPRLALAIALTESNLNPAAVSPKNAMGVMQLIPETAERFNVRKPFDPEENIKGGLAYLRWLLAYFEGDVALAAAAYNAGEGAVDRHRGVPPYRETQGYVERVLAFVRLAVHPYDSEVASPSPMLGYLRSKAGPRVQ